MVKIAFFDIDGTVLNKQLPLLFVDYLRSNKVEFRGENHAEKIQLEKDLYKFRLVYKKSNMDEDFTDYSLALIDYMMLRLQGYSGPEVRELAKAALCNAEAEAYRFSLVLIDELRRRGYALVAISGSPQSLVDEFVNAFGFNEGIGQKYEHRNGLGYYQPSGVYTYKDKHRFIEEYICRNHPTRIKEAFNIVSVGDTTGDFEMLKFGRAGFAINPSQGLLAKIAGLPQRISVVTERKNVVSFSELGDISFSGLDEVPVLATTFCLSDEAIRSQIRATLSYKW